MNPNWPKEVLKKNRREIISGAIFVVTSTLAFLVWHFFVGGTFVWTNISPISTPLEYGLYSALVFGGPGAYLYYKTDFYKNLWHLRKIDRDLHRGVKKIFWLTMCLIMLAIVIAVVWLLNQIISFFYNIIRLILFLSPPLGIGLVVAIVSYLLLKKDWIIGSQ